MLHSTLRRIPGAARAGRIVLISLVTLAACIAPARAAGPLPRRAMLVSLDGLRPDVALRANMPALRSVMARGSWTMWARTSPMSITLPSHTTMLTGVPPAKHGITWNDDKRHAEVEQVAWPTVFTLAHRAGLTTGIAVGKVKLTALAAPGTAEFRALPAVADSLMDLAVADTVVRWLVGPRPQFLFVHLPSLDLAGHAVGWGSARQVAVAERVDRALGRILRALDQTGLADSTLIVITADHGGVSRNHGMDDPRSHTVPWIAAGPGVRRGFDITSESDVPVDLQDTFAVLCERLGLVPPQPVDGKTLPVIADTAR